MNKIKNILSIIPIHPFIFALYPVLFLWVENIDQTPFFVIFRSILQTEGLALFVYVVTSLIYRNLKSSAIITSLTVILTLSYGHIFNFIEDHPPLINFVGYYRLLAIFIIVLVACAFFVWRYKSTVHLLNQIMNTTSILLLTITILQALLFYMSMVSEIDNSSNMISDAPSTLTSADFDDRDIYYIILDGYGRQDLLDINFDYDNSSFINELKDLGFVIPECTQSNYNSTAFSMISSLNMDYLEELPISLKDSKEIDFNEIAPHLRNSAVRKKFEELGYLTVSFKVDFPFLVADDTDIFYDFEKETDRYDKIETDNFQYLFYNTTVLRIIIELQETEQEYVRLFKHYNMNLYAFEQLENIPTIPGNKYVYAHLLSTHQPFVFTADGQVRWPIEENYDAYKDQITYTNSRMIEIIQTIINTSTTPPVIILQADHSYARGIDRNKILNAYYLPEYGEEMISSDFSPVNTFRLIFNMYYGEEFELLPNQAFTSDDDHPYQFELLPESCEDSE